MVTRRNSNGNGKDIPAWFKVFLAEYHADREATSQALKLLAESVQHLAVEMRDSIGKLHEAQIETSRRLDRLEQAQERTNHELERLNRDFERFNNELVRTRKQSAHLFGRLISEVKALGRR